MGGKGSGPQRGGSKVPKSMTISKAASALSKKGYQLGPATTDLKKMVTSYRVIKDGKSTTMTAKQVSKLASS